ncbi:MAG: hypothetical protein ACYDAE_25110 [Steroidobacteraceae bacterium]
MQFSISASGTSKRQVLDSLEAQREIGPDHSSLKNQVIEHIAAHVDTLPEDATSLSVSGSFYLGYSLPTKSEGEASGS